MVQFYESACVVFPLTAAKPFVCAGQSKNSSDSIDAPDNLLCWREPKYISREGCFFFLLFFIFRNIWFLITYHKSLWKSLSPT